MNTIDLRSDTVTRPSAAMRQAIASAEVGDDQYGDDPTVNLLQERCAKLFGKEAALFLPTGTMCNQVALRTLTRPGDDVVVSHESHAVWHEAGASGANAGVQFTAIGSKGMFTLEELLAALKPLGHMLYPPTSLIEIENTHNRAGGVVLPQAEIVKICGAARERGVATYLDGARVWNAAVASGKPVGDLAAPFDLVGACFSKGLGAPVGSILAGTRATIDRANRYRRMFGGAMRQSGLLAAACLYALDHNLPKLEVDHANAKKIAQRLAKSPRLKIDLSTVQTNIVVFDVADGGPDSAAVVAEAKRRGLLLNPVGPRKLRVVTHLDVSADACAQAADMLAAIAEG
ncbi:MAG: GntG family PLP-dependent aldolase [Myxococcaceae bacterium]